MIRLAVLLGNYSAIHTINGF